jgi:integrase
LLPQLELRVEAGTAPPRLHDLRHSFAVGTLLRWYRCGIDPQSGLLRLATFLGHVDPVSTAVYLTISDPLLEEANRRFETFARTVIKEERP